ncbi:hypothetical protein COBT_003409 [Conglomerata obtusa]
MQKRQIFKTVNNLTVIYKEDKHLSYSTDGFDDDIRLGCRIEYKNEAKNDIIVKKSFFDLKYIEKRTFKNRIKIKTLNNVYTFMFCTVIYRNRMNESVFCEFLYFAFASLYYMDNNHYKLHSRYHYSFDDTNKTSAIVKLFHHDRPNQLYIKTESLKTVLCHIKTLLTQPFFTPDVNITKIFYFANQYKIFNLHQDVFKKKVTGTRFCLYSIYKFVLTTINMSFCETNTMKVYHATIHKQNFYKHPIDKLCDESYIKNLRIIQELDCQVPNKRIFYNFETILITFSFNMNNNKQNCYFILPIKEQYALNLLSFFLSNNYTNNLYRVVGNNLDRKCGNFICTIFAIIVEFMYDLNIYANLRLMLMHRLKKKLNHLLRCALYKAIEKHSEYKYRIDTLKLDMDVFDWYESNDTYTELYKRPGYKILCNFFADDNKLFVLLKYLKNFFLTRSKVF